MDSGNSVLQVPWFFRFSGSSGSLVLQVLFLFGYLVIWMIVFNKLLWIRFAPIPLPVVQVYIRSYPTYLSNGIHNGSLLFWCRLPTYLHVTLPQVSKLKLNLTLPIRYPHMVRLEWPSNKPRKVRSNSFSWWRELFSIRLWECCPRLI